MTWIKQNFGSYRVCCVSLRKEFLSVCTILWPACSPVIVWNIIIYKWQIIWIELQLPINNIPVCQNHYLKHICFAFFVTVAWLLYQPTLDLKQLNNRFCILESNFQFSWATLCPSYGAHLLNLYPLQRGKIHQIRAFSTSTSLPVV